MNFPYWEVSWAGSGFFIALIAISHVFISHFAVGGGLWLVLSEIRARRNNDTAMLEYVRSHTKFFLLVTMVAGALSGVGIWLAISVYSPGATSFMIHTFVMAWATEWVFFFVEIVSLFVYYHYWDSMEPGKHIFVGWVYFIAAWMSLFLINGIISFMLTPGAWLKTQSMWDGFFNPTFVPSLAFRTALALVMAGVYGILTSSWLKDAELRQRMVRWCAIWLGLPIVGALITGYSYLEALPALHKGFVLGGSPEILPYFKGFLWISPILFGLAVVAIVKLPQKVQVGLSVALMVLGFMYIGSFEYVREASRRPYIVGDYMYSNNVLKSDLAKVQKAGVLKSAQMGGAQGNQRGEQAVRGQGAVQPDLSALSFGGRRLERHSAQDGQVPGCLRPGVLHFGDGQTEPVYAPLPGQCRRAQRPGHLFCASSRSKKKSLTEKAEPSGSAQFHAALPDASPRFRFAPADPRLSFMAVYPGPPSKEIRLVADQKIIQAPSTVAKKKLPVKVVSKNNYILLASTNQSMHFQVVAPGKLALLTPPSHIKAQLIKRGEVPELITQGVELEFSLLDPQPKLRTPGYWSELKKYFKDLSAPKGKLALQSGGRGVRIGPHGAGAL